VRWECSRGIPASVGSTLARLNDDRQPKLSAELGELGLIERLTTRFGPAPAGETWAGDDAAVVRCPAETLLFATDLLVEGVDFDLGWCSGADIGWKAIAANVSDLAAMGGRPSAAVVAVGLGTGPSPALVDGLAEGMASASKRWHLGLVGGDLSGSGEVSVSVAMIGAPGPGGPVYRSGARPGDAICVTGALGGAAEGLRLLRAGARGSDDPATARLIRRQLRPAARLDEGTALGGAGVSSMIDVSDGLLADLGHLLDASAAGCDLLPTAIPVDPDLVAVTERWPESRPGPANGAGAEPLTSALTGGEDFELLFTIEEGRLAELGPLVEAGVSRIGTVTRGGRFVGRRAFEEWEQQGWDHLRPR